MRGRRVALTGFGIVGPYGNNVASSFSALVEGRSAVDCVQIDSAAGKLTCVGAATRDEPSLETWDPSIATSDKVSIYALAAAGSAIVDANLDFIHEDLTRVGISVGTSLGGVLSQETAYHAVIGKSKTRVDPFTLIKVMHNGPAAQIALKYGIGGPSLTYSTTCSSSSVSIGEAMRAIRHGYADVMIAGGAEALFSYVAIKAWQALHVLAPPRLDDVSATCRPFDRGRNGTVLGDGAAFVVLEDFTHATKRGATIHAELAGYGVCNDSAHMAQPSMEAQIRAMELALADAQMAPDAVDYLNAHGTGTRLNDVTETRAIRKCFGSYADKLAVSSTKSMHGHLVGAAGALEVIISAMAVCHQCVPPTAHLHDPDPQCDLDYVPNNGRHMRVRAAMTNSFAVGGTAGVVVIKGTA